MSKINRKAVLEWLDEIEKVYNHCDTIELEAVGTKYTKNGVKYFPGSDREYSGPIFCRYNYSDVLRLKVYNVDFPEKGIPFYGIFHEAWEACCRAHNIDWNNKEEERFSEASCKSFYNPDNVRKREKELQNLADNDARSI